VASSDRSTISIGGNVSGSAVAAGRSIKQNVGSGDQAASANLAEAVQALKEAMTGLTGPYAAIANNAVDQAAEESKKEKPDHHFIGAAIDSALAAGKKVGEFGDLVAKISPWVMRLGVLLAPYGFQLGL
jgi:uncharacterized iron-regulated protein